MAADQLCCLCSHPLDQHQADDHGGCVVAGCGCGQFIIGTCGACDQPITPGQTTQDSLVGLTHSRCPEAAQLGPDAVQILVDWHRAGESYRSAKKDRRRADRAGHTNAAAAHLSRTMQAVVELAARLADDRSGS